MTMQKIKEKRLYAAAAWILALACTLPLLLHAFCGQASGAPAAEAARLFRRGDREMRGLWIATVYGLDFPSAAGLSAKTLAEELDGIVAFAKENGFNTLMFQARPAADALYRSEIFPASVFVSGVAGQPPDGGFDCLAYLVGRAHREEIAVYAWVNPLRAGCGSPARPFDRAALAENSPAALHPEWTVAYADGKLYFDAGIPAVRALVADGVREICENYAVDGVIFDDYFYPAPVGDTPFDDAAAFAAYGGDFANVGDFRRDAVNKLVELCYDTVKAVDDKIRFGVSPRGIWKNLSDAVGGRATRGAEAYSEIYCDALAWVRGGYVDFLAPQIYWSFEDPAAPFGTLADFWSRALAGSGVDLYIGHGVYRYAEGDFPRGELTAQVLYARDLPACRGGLYYGCGALRRNANGVADEIGVLFGEAREK